MEYEILTDVNGVQLKPGDYVSFKLFPRGTDTGWMGISSYITIGDVPALVFVSQDSVYTDIGSSSLRKLKKQIAPSKEIAEILNNVPRRWKAVKEGIKKEMQQTKISRIANSLEKIAANHIEKKDKDTWTNDLYRVIGILSATSGVSENMAAELNRNPDLLQRFDKEKIADIISTLEKAYDHLALVQKLIFKR